LHLLKGRVVGNDQRKVVDRKVYQGKREEGNIGGNQSRKSANKGVRKHGKLKEESTTK